MTEEEKALAGMFYFAGEAEIDKERIRSQDLSWEYNQIKPSDKAARDALVRREMKKTGKNFRIEQPFHCDFWGRVSLGENFFSNYNFTILAGNMVTIGDNVIIGANSTVTHDIPPGMVAAGTPAKVICTLEEYLKKETERMQNAPCYGEEYTLRKDVSMDMRMQQKQELQGVIGYID